MKFTADDVIFTAKMLADHKELTARRRDARGRQGDDQGRRLHDRRRDQPAGASVSSPASAPSSMAAVSDRAAACLEGQGPLHLQQLSSGHSRAYSLEKEDPNGSWVLWKRREDWQHSDVGAAIGKPNPGYVLFRFFGPEEKRVLAMAQNKIDILMDISADSFQNLRSHQSPCSRAGPRIFPTAISTIPARAASTSTRRERPTTSGRPAGRWRSRPTRWTSA